MNMKGCLETILVLLLISSVQQCSSDQALTHFNSEVQHILKHKPKHWYAYIKMFMLRLTEKNTFKNIYSKIILFEALKFSKIFKSFNRQLLMFNNFGKEKTNCYNKILVACPSGQIFVSGFHQQQHQYNFHMSIKLMLNITVHNLYFGSGVDNCHEDNLTVANLEDKSQFHHYCGHLTMFNFYPKFSDLRVQITAMLFFHIEIKFTFVVIDKGPIYTLSKTIATPKQVLFTNNFGSKFY